MKMHTQMSLIAGFAIGILLFEFLAPPQAEAVYGGRRRTARRTAVVVSSANNAETAAAQQQAAPADQEAAAANQEAEAPKAETEATKQQAAGAQPIGTIVNQLPPGCTQTTVGNVAYQKCGADYYRAAFQGSQLVYVTTQP